ncbi:SAM-dependent methyltransferase [Salmonella enterica subsp. enterica serovar Wilhelmsburg]|uniref:SAM-dependent methyltransferase n=1 Tax=Salmonella enterica subsp. enterica serovar Wilhelmsburg TaxID=1960126 RepID=A0A659QPD2_SALET|nr:class I SAM-dependent methyltransferase [Salmonella enterica]TGC62283.1 SAM-dependent methyltransferase [Salmonella enterica subsp. enterica serovar Wilhelmsburg]TGC64038.1 SAM-dependent methyltransferase [Salmonella enterica subsp. enterica serovar Wilhelmsburg]TGC73275.1 SAM-dependent methyltransferase [Salmonella enterica subsp. enterica serovar Wilhelmsburg]TGC80008.1 SAM-dependent methyltransferase [Salmonella enterica subsp. enterica serovar Wilhelmsburg]TGC88267.1 SAM-dependent methy
MDLRLKFNEDVLNYDKWRPRYSSELFKDIIAYAALDDANNVLEIGIGTGQATLPILQTGCKVRAIDIGDDLVKFSKRKFSDFPSFEVEHIDFESFVASANNYDLIYSATAFHWVDQDTGFKKIYNLLKPGGTVALFWNHPFVSRKDDELHIEIQKIYRKYRPSGTPPVEFTKDNLEKYKNILHKYGFVDITSRLYHKTRKFKANDYISLLNTYSDHREMACDIKDAMEKEISLIIDRFGGVLSVYDTIDLYLARKPLKILSI